MISANYPIRGKISFADERRLFPLIANHQAGQIGAEEVDATRCRYHKSIMIPAIQLEGNGSPASGNIRSPIELHYVVKNASHLHNKNIPLKF